MRLVCPNCDAEYEVDERVIPGAGRDVQCSNCGHAWFQNPDGVAEKPDEASEAPRSDDDAFVPDDPIDDNDAAQTAIDEMIRDNEDSEGDDPSEDTADEDDFDDDAEYDDEQGGDHGDDHGDDQDTDQGDDQNGDESPLDDNDQDEAPAPRELDEGVRDILRQEAELETQARDGEREGVEVQDELGLEESASNAPIEQAAQERMARLRGLDVDDTNAAGGSGARRDLLPDIEEINSSLAPIGSNDVEDDFAEPEARKSGFSRGFAIIIILAILIVGLYIYAPWISEKVPALASTMDAYVGLINSMRDGLDRMVQAALAKLK